MTTKSRRKVAMRPLSSFREYQSIVERTDESKRRIISLLGLVGEIGDLHSMMKKLLVQKDNPSFRNELREELGDVLWYLTSLASLYKIPLQELATANAKKAESFYSSGNLNVFDARFPEDERIPRRFEAVFSQKTLKRGVRVRMSVNDITIGDELTDNAHTKDGYRYHDVFHLAYAAVLGWSPVIRRLFRRKRKSDARVDEIEDGARAAIVEEAISIFVFNHARERGWYSDPSAIDIGMLKIIRRMVEGLEVRACTAKQWKSAIAQGYAAFNLLQKHKGGRVLVDLDAQKITYLDGGCRP